MGIKKIVKTAVEKINALLDFETDDYKDCREIQKAFEDYDYNGITLMRYCALHYNLWKESTLKSGKSIFVNMIYRHKSYNFSLHFGKITAIELINFNDAICKLNKAGLNISKKEIFEKYICGVADDNGGTIVNVNLG